ncbi:MAG: hypothetical protein NXI04_30155 [Planctomycetaceae bacterium]|nr:hypothetical protein [Planctomycetaceae bacterium]
MSSDLTILKYAGSLPATMRDIDDRALRPLGSMGHIRTLLSEHFSDIEWETTPPLLSIVKKHSESWREWTAEELERHSQPSLKAHTHNDHYMISFYGLPVDDSTDVNYLLVEMHAAGNPYRPLKPLCDSNGWVAVGPNPDDQFIDFDNAIAEWDDFERNEAVYLEEARERDRVQRDETKDFNNACLKFAETVLNGGAVCPKCAKEHDHWRCVVPSRPDRRAYFVCKECGGSIEKADFTLN